MAVGVVGTLSLQLLLMVGMVLWCAGARSDARNWVEAVLMCWGVLNSAELG
jgi:hypothetical protein